MSQFLKEESRFKFAPLARVLSFEREAASRGVSEVARSPRGFLTAFKKAGGHKSKLSLEWRRKRIGFIKRHLAQYKKNRTARRWLALMMWAYEG